MITHRHHIVPIHAGGNNDPSNLVELTVAEHAEAHRKLFEQYGRWQDEIAWKTLSGQITTAEANAISNSRSKQGEANPNFGKIGSMRGRTGESHPSFGKKVVGRKMPKRSEEVRQKIRMALLGRKHSAERVEANRLGQIRRYSDI